MITNTKWLLPLLLTLPAVASGEALMTDAVFAPTSFWYTPIPASAPLHSNSANYVKEFLRQKAAYYNTVNVNTRDYTSTVFIAQSGAATVKVTPWDCQKKGFTDSGLAQQFAAVPVPSNAVPSKGSDAEMTVYQPSTRTLWEFWQARKVDGRWQACWGGRIVNTAANGGVFSGTYGVAATSLSFMGGQITAEELKRGEIKHAIGISLVDLEKSSIFSWPANRSDGWNPYNAINRIPEGTRFRLNPAVNVDALPMTRAGKIIAKAAQKYGFVVWDRAGALSIRARNSYSYMAAGQPDPYPALFDGKPGYSVLNGFPWDKLQFLPKHYGRPY